MFLTRRDEMPCHVSFPRISDHHIDRDRSEIKRVKSSQPAASTLRLQHYVYLKKTAWLSTKRLNDIARKNLAMRQGMPLLRSPLVANIRRRFFPMPPFK